MSLELDYKKMWLVMHTTHIDARSLEIHLVAGKEVNHFFGFVEVNQIWKLGLNAKYQTKKSVSVAMDDESFLETKKFAKPLSTNQIDNLLVSISQLQ